MNLDNCSRRIADISDQELTGLIGNQEENQWIDFKQRDYHRDPNDLEKRQREICKDVTAMANAEGGYILIGVDEKAGLAQGFVNVTNPKQIARSIRGICLSRIDPPIENLQVVDRSFEYDGKDISLVIVHIPPSESRPHGFKSQGYMSFVKRYDTDTREYPMTDLGVDFSARHLPQPTNEIDEIVNKLNRIDSRLENIECLLNKDP